MDSHHDLVQLRVSFLEGPLGPARVLLHLKTRGCNATSVRCLAGRVKDTRATQLINGLGSGGHICTLRDHLHAVADQGLDALKGEFVLSCTRKCDITGNFPDRALSTEVSARTLVCIVADTSATAFLHVF